MPSRGSAAGGRAPGIDSLVRWRTIAPRHVERLSGCLVRRVREDQAGSAVEVKLLRNGQS